MLQTPAIEPRKELSLNETLQRAKQSAEFAIQNLEALRAQRYALTEAIEKIEEQLRDVASPAPAIATGPR